MKKKYVKPQVVTRKSVVQTFPAAFVASVSLVTPQLLASPRLLLR